MYGVSDAEINKFIVYSFKGCEVVRLTDKPVEWRHSCKQVGVLAPIKPQRYVYKGVVIDFMQCKSCGKVIYYVNK